MTKVTHCETCGKKFNLVRWRHNCNACGKVICGKCKTKTLDLNLRSQFYGRTLVLCPDCWRKLDNDYRRAQTVKVVSSGHVRGHKTIKTLGKIYTKIHHREPRNAKNELQFNAYELGGNAILNYYYHKHTHSEPGRGEGTHYYTCFTAEGTVAIVEPYRR